MNKTDKAGFVTQFRGSITDSSVVIVAHYKGMSVSEMHHLRSKAKAAGAQLKVVKNRLMRLVIDGTPYAPLEPLLKGPTVLAFSKDPVPVAKVMQEFSKQNEKLVLLGGVLDHAFLPIESVKALAELPSLDELRAKLISLILAPSTKLARLAQAPSTKLYRIFKAYEDSVR